APAPCCCPPRGRVPGDVAACAITGGIAASSAVRVGDAQISRAGDRSSAAAGVGSIATGRSSSSAAVAPVQPARGHPALIVRRLARHHAGPDASGHAAAAEFVKTAADQHVVRRGGHQRAARAARGETRGAGPQQRSAVRQAAAAAAAA
ncbi:unnamed protein product, partial [Ectocarpus fasciculatus]